ncbi:MAG: hypothetical protein ABI567_10080 [Gammaproteobacteria bacterium]
MSDKQLNTGKALEKPDRILELELAGVLRNSHYSFMVYGLGRFPIVLWLRGQSDESLLHAHSDPLEVVAGKCVKLEEYSTRMISDETRHAGDVRKMLRASGK